MSLRSLVRFVDVSALNDKIETLLNRLTAARAELIDQITAARMEELDSAGLPTDTFTLLDRLTAARAALIDDIDTLLDRLTAARAALIDKIPLAELEQMYSSDESQVTLNTTGSDQSLGSKNITVALPSGASVVRAIAAALIIVNNRTANAEDIDLNLNVAGTSIFSQDDVVSFGDAIGTTALTVAQDCTAEITGDGTFAFEAEAQISAAQNVTFTVMYLLYVQYKMS